MKEVLRLLITDAADQCVKIRRLSDENRRRNLSATLSHRGPIWLATWRVGKTAGRGVMGRRGERGGGGGASTRGMSERGAGRG